MKLRLNVERIVLPNNESLSVCGEATTAFKTIGIEMWVNGTKVWDTPNVDTTPNAIVTPITVGALTVTCSTETVNAYIVTEIAGLEIWESATVDVIITKAGYRTYTNTYTVYGYDLGNNPNVNNANGDPIDYNPDTTIVLVPEMAAFNRASVTNGTITITADVYGPSGNGISIVGDGITSWYNLVTAWNAANPTNTVTILPFIFALPIPILGETLTTSGGVDEIYNYAYSKISGWSAPLTNVQHYYNMSSSPGTTSFSNSDNVQVGLGQTATVCCNDLPVKITTVTYDLDHCTCGAPEVFDTCVSAEMLATTYSLKPLYFATIACDTCCETEDSCLVVQGNNNVIVSIDPNSLSTMWVDDDDVIGTGTIEISYELYNSAGLIVSMDTAVWDYATPVQPTWPIALPTYGDYILKFMIGITDVFVCSTNYTFTGCNQYHIKQLDCNTFRVYNYSASKTNLRVHMLNGDKVFELVQSYAVNECSYVDVVANKDGVYNFNIGVIAEQNLIVVVDCGIRACYLDYLNKLACSGKSSCTCGGKCASGCSAIPFDFYNFNAFMALVYAYFSLLNEEYIDHYIYNGADTGTETDFATSDIDRFYNIHLLLERAAEYCTVCESVKDNTGCITCK